MSSPGSLSGPPIFVAGMHRSGTSMTGRLLSALGLALGDQLIPADEDNRHGYFEDRELVALNRRILAGCVEAGAGGWPDWGWTEPLRWREPDRARWLPEARALLARRAGSARSGAWKDPRTTVLLDFWAEAARDARFVLVYRFPWEVADSMQRLRPGIFRKHPGYAHAIWRHYNRRILDFQRRHPARCALVSTNFLVNQPESLGPLLETRFGVHLPPESAVEVRNATAREAFHSSAGPDPLVRLLRATHPESLALLDELEAAADLPAGLATPPALRLTAAVGPAVEPPCAIVVPCHDHGEFLVEAVASAERHAPAGAELIIVDDGSREPRTVEILAALAALGYRVLRRDHAGLAAARNAGIAATRAPVIVPLDADNRLLAGYIEAAQEIFATDPAVGVVYSDRVEFGAARGRVVLRAFTTEEMLRVPRVDACALFRRRVWEQAGGYDPRLPRWEDWEFWIHALRLGWKLVHVPSPGFEYRVREGSLCRDEPDWSEARAWFAWYYEKHGEFLRRELGHAQTESSYVRQALRDCDVLPRWSRARLRRWLGRRSWWPLLRRLRVALGKGRISRETKGK